MHPWRGPYLTLLGLVDDATGKVPVARFQLQSEDAVGYLRLLRQQVEQIAQIAASMREFGFLWPIMVDGATRRIVAGNGRYLAALQLGLPVVPVVEEWHLTPIQRRAFIIADNKIALNAGWADDILRGSCATRPDAHVGNRMRV